MDTGLLMIPCTRSSSTGMLATFRFRVGCIMSLVQLPLSSLSGRQTGSPGADGDRDSEAEGVSTERHRIRHALDPIGPGVEDLRSQHLPSLDLSRIHEAERDHQPSLRPAPDDAEVGMVQCFVPDDDVAGSVQDHQGRLT